MNPANSLTVARIILSPIFLVLFLSHSPTLNIVSTFVFIIAALTDALDGQVARKYGYQSDFGVFMDPLADKVLTAAAWIAFVQTDYMPAWMAYAMITRELLITGLRSISAASVGDMIQPSVLGKAKTVVQMVVIIAVLVWSNMSTVALEARWPQVSTALIHPIIPWSIEMLLWVAVLLTVGTGLEYTYRYASVVRAAFK